MTTIWNIDPAHSGITFSVRHLVISRVRGRFAKYTGTIHLDDRDFSRSSVEVAIDASSIDTGTPQRDAHLRSADFFDVETLAELRFRSTSVEGIGGRRFRVTGDLTIRDVTHEVTLEAEYGGRAKDPWGNERIGYVAKTAIDRSDYGLAWSQVLAAGGALIGDRVEIELDVQAVNASASVAA